MQVTDTLEIGLVPMLKRGQYPGLFLFSTPSRMVRPVINLATNVIEMIGSFEQVLSIHPAIRYNEWYSREKLRMPWFCIKAQLIYQLGRQVHFYNARSDVDVSVSLLPPRRFTWILLSFSRKLTEG